MRIRLRDIQEAVKELVFDESTSELNQLFEHEPVRDYEFTGPVTARIRYYRSGTELFFTGEVSGEVVGQCARCLEGFTFRLTAPFSFVFVPRVSRWTGDADAGDVDLYSYAGDEIDLSPSLREHILLSLPTLPLCDEGCLGLCPQCGANRNCGACGCQAQGDPRLSVLRNLRARG